MDLLWIVVPATAVLTALATVGLAALVVRRGLERRQAELERRLEEALARSAGEAGEAMERRLRAVIADALADFRRSGAAGVAGSAGRTAAVTGAELLQEGLRLLMGGPPKPPARP